MNWSMLRASRNRTVAGLLLAAAVGAMSATASHATTFTLSLSGNVADFNYFSFNSGGTHFDQGVLALSGLGDMNAITVNQGDTIDMTLTLDQAFTVPASQLLTTHIINLTGPDFPAGSTASLGTMDFYLGGSHVTGVPDTVSTTSGQVGDAAGLFPPDNGSLTFDTIISDFTITTLSGPATLNSSTYYYTLFSHAVPEPATWAMMLMGFGGLGAVLRRCRTHAAFSVT